MNSADSIIDGVIDWGHSRGIMLDSTPMRQFTKAVEEMGELASALLDKDEVEVKDGIGDVTVCMILLAALSGEDIRDILEEVLAELNTRQGVMKNGVFVKDEE